MRQKIIRFFDNIFVSIIVNLAWNFGLWFLVSTFFFSEEFSWASFSYFLSNSYHLAILVVVITLIGEWTSVHPKSYLPLSSPKSIFSKIWAKVQSIFWLIINILNFSIWLIFDSWRKPNVELFTRMPIDQVAKAMVDACKEEIEIAKLNNRSPITGYFSKFYFSLLKWSPTPFGKVAVINSTILYGKMYEVKKGVFIRAWHRFPTAFLLFITLWLNGFTGFILSFWESSKFAFIALDIAGTFGWLLFFMWINTKIAREEKIDINTFLKNIFSPTTAAQQSVQRMAGSRRP
jgi:hypothetical protein